MGVEGSWEYRSDVMVYDTMPVVQDGGAACVWERRYREGGGELGLTHTGIYHHYLSHFYHR